MAYFDRIRPPIGMDPSGFDKIPPEVYEVIPVVKTDWQAELVRTTITIAHEFVRGLDIVPKELSEERVLLVDHEKIEQMLAGTDGNTTWRWVYIDAELDRYGFAHTLTHEIAHAISYSLLRVAVEPGEPPNYHYSEARSGYEVRQPVTDHPTFTGLNEAVTEMVAGGFRSLLSEGTDLLDESSKNDLIEFRSYWPNIQVVLALLELTDEKVSTLFHDYLTGRMDFVRAVERARPGSARILAYMDGTHDSAHWAAIELGLDKTAAKILSLL